MASETTFEAREGWVAVSSDGSMWCHRRRGSAGVLVIERTEQGKKLYQATHQDCFSTDTSLTTQSRRKAVRFAVEGSAGSSPDAAVELSVEARRAEAAHGPESGHAGLERTEIEAEIEAKAGILDALDHLSLADRKEILARLLQLEASENAP